MRTVALSLAAFSLIALSGCASMLDSDGDGISNADEAAAGTDPDNVDTDGDGLRDGGEAERGTDPLEADTDGDGLSDGEEVKDYGSDPLAEDSDGDGYLDPWEVAEGSDPADANSKIYQGGWPYQPDKAAYQQGAPTLDTLSGTAKVGDKLVQGKFVDQWGDEVDLYDFAGQGQYIILDYSAEWCPPCNGLASWLYGGSDSYGFESTWSTVDDKVNDGTIRWLTFLGEDNAGNIPSVDVLHSWEEKYPHPNIPVLAGDPALQRAYLTQGWPTLWLLDENLEVIVAPGSSQAEFWAAMDEADAL